MTTLDNIIDTEQLLRNTSRDRELISELMFIFERELPALEAQLTNALRQGDFPAIEQTVHKLKGSLLMFGARCVSLAGSVELDAKRGGAPSFPELCEDLKTEAARVIPALEALLKAGEL